MRHDWRSGIQRVVKNYLMEFLLSPPAGCTVIPVYATREESGYRTAEAYLLELAGVEGITPNDTPLQPQAGDIFLGLDLQPFIVPMQAPYLEELRRMGVGLAFMVYDLLPVRLPDCFSPGAAPDHERWLRAIAKADMAICISQAVADDLAQWLGEHREAFAPGLPPQIRAVHPGADPAALVSTQGLPQDAPALLEQLRKHPAFLMVGTLEPRKAHNVVLAAFERLWQRGEDCTLVIVGRTGWMVDQLVAALRAHPERGNRLIWIEDSSDELLEQVYAASACLVAASRGEGFGLPLVEAAQHGLAIIARDIPVFREVAGEHAFYFEDDSPDGLADALSRWLALFRNGQQPTPQGMHWNSWRASADGVKRLLLHHDWPKPVADG